MGLLSGTKLIVSQSFSSSELKNSIAMIVSSKEDDRTKVYAFFDNNVVETD